jgi:hypothetical protein
MTSAALGGSGTRSGLGHVLHRNPSVGCCQDAIAPQVQRGNSTGFHEVAGGLLTMSRPSFTTTFGLM